MREERDRADQHRPAGQALQETSRDEHLDALRKSAKRGSRAEGNDADQEGSLPAKAVCQRTRCHQDGGACQRVGVHHPLHLLEVATKRPLQIRQDHRYARDLEAEHQRTETYGEQRNPVLAGWTEGHVRAPSQCSSQNRPRQARYLASAR
jgi:hypothetical protein